MYLGEKKGNGGEERFCVCVSLCSKEGVSDGK